MVLSKKINSNKFLIVCFSLILILSVYLILSSALKQSFIPNLTVITLKSYDYYFPSLAQQLRQSELIDFAKGSNESQLKIWLKVVPPDRLINEYQQLFPDQPLPVCHQNAHSIGRLIYQNSKEEAFGYHSNWCNSGLIHGVVDEFIHDQGFAPTKMQQICSELGPENKVGECIHGIGHGLLAYEDYNINQAITDCQQLRVNSKLSMACYQGVFMENYTASLSDSANAHQVKWPISSLDYPCNIVEKSYPVQWACVVTQVVKVFTMSNRDFSQVVSFCSINSDFEQFREACFYSLGFHAASFLKTTQLEKLLLECNCTGEDRTGFIKGALSIWLKTQSVSSNPNLCNVNNLDDKKNCYELLGQQLENQYRDDPEVAKKICNQVEPGFKNECLGGFF